MITVQADAASSEKGHGSSASAAAQAAAQEAMLPHMMEALWQMNVLDIEMTLEKVVDKVLHDRAISKKVCECHSDCGENRHSQRSALYALLVSSVHCTASSVT